jgi:histidyl-tRNA synthetase
LADKIKNNDDGLKEITINDITIHVGDTVYYARLIPQCGLCTVEELTVRYIYEELFTGLNKITKNVLSISNNLMGKRCFTSRKDAKKVVDEAKKSGLIKQVSKEKDIDDED